MSYQPGWGPPPPPYGPPGYGPPGFGPPGYGPPGYPGPPQRGSSKALWVLAAVLGLPALMFGGCIVCASGGLMTRSTRTERDEPRAVATAATETAAVAPVPWAEPPWLAKLVAITSNPTAQKPVTKDVNPAAGVTTYTYAIPPLSQVELTVRLLNGPPSAWDLQMDAPGLAASQLAPTVTEVCSKKSQLGTMSWLRLDGGPLHGTYVIRWTLQTSLIVRSRDGIVAMMKDEGATGDVEPYLRGRCGG